MGAVSALRVMFVSGSVLPADLAYGGLVTVLGVEVETIVKDLDVYPEDAPPPGYSLDTEVAGVLREADARGWDHFHLAGTQQEARRHWPSPPISRRGLQSLSLLEPAWVGTGAGAQEHRHAVGGVRRVGAVIGRAVDAGVHAAAGASGGSVAGSATRSTAAVDEATTGSDPGRHAHVQDLRPRPRRPGRLRRPVYFALGGLSNPDQFREEAERLGNVFGDFTLEVFAERHHFDPPHRIEPERLAASLRAIWARSSSIPPAARQLL